MKSHIIFVAFAVLALALSVACAPNQSPDQIREKTAEETATLKRDTKAVAEGVKEGLTSDSKKTGVKVDLNQASKDDLSALPGITGRTADRIIAERPYASTHQLVTRHLVSEDEYAQINDRVMVKH